MQTAALTPYDASAATVFETGRDQLRQRFHEAFAAETATRETLAALADLLPPAATATVRRLLAERRADRNAALEASVAGPAPDKDAGSGAGFTPAEERLLNEVFA